MSQQEKYYITHHLTGTAKQFAHQAAKKIEQEFGVPSLANKAPFHITLKSPFVLLENQLDILEDMLLETTNNRSIFGVEFGGVGVFDNDQEQTVYLESKNTTDLDDLSRAIKQGFVEVTGQALGGYEDNPVYHASIANGELDGDTDAIHKLVSGLYVPNLITRVEAIALMRRVGKLPWEIFAEYPLLDSDQ
jgi:2'-5' RNA ligase